MGRISLISLIEWEEPITLWNSHKGYGICSSADDHLELLSEKPAGYMKVTSWRKEMPEGLLAQKIKLED